MYQKRNRKLILKTHSAELFGRECLSCKDFYAVFAELSFEIRYLFFVYESMVFWNPNSHNNCSNVIFNVQSDIQSYDAKNIYCSWTIIINPLTTRFSDSFHQAPLLRLRSENSLSKTMLPTVFDCSFSESCLKVEIS